MGDGLACSGHSICSLSWFCWPCSRDAHRKVTRGARGNRCCRCRRRRFILHCIPARPELLLCGRHSFSTGFVWACGMAGRSGLLLSSCHVVDIMRKQPVKFGQLACRDILIARSAWLSLQGGACLFRPPLFTATSLLQRRCHSLSRLSLRGVWDRPTDIYRFCAYSISGAKNHNRAWRCDIHQWYRMKVISPS